jgi:hypothetical protein
VQARELDEVVVAAVVVQDARAVDVRTRGDQEIRRGSAAVMPAGGEIALGCEACRLDVAGYLGSYSDVSRS